MMKNECDEVRRTAPAGKLVSPKAAEPMQTASKWLLEGGIAICCDMLDKLDRHNKKREPGGVTAPTSPAR